MYKIEVQNGPAARPNPLQFLKRWAKNGFLRHWPRNEWMILGGDKKPAALRKEVWTA